MKRLLVLLVLLFVFVNAKATHLMGGEITWECVKDSASPDLGKYIFYMKIYRDCDGNPFNTILTSLDVWNHPSVTQIPLNLLSSDDISPDCDVLNSGNGALDCATNPVGAVEEFIFASQPIILAGSPPNNGWHFSWETCCRNGAISNLFLTAPAFPQEGFTLRASMYPYLDNAGNPVPADPCFDNSPRFNESPQTIICTGYPFAYTHNASDNELDSIVYDWDEPLDYSSSGVNPAVGLPWNPGPGGNPNVVPWLAPYTVNSPLPGGVVLDSQTGEISYNSNISGNFVSVIRVDAFKCGQLVASVYREIQAVLINCPTLPGGINNSPPVVSPPFPLPNQYYTTVSAGDLVTFNISAFDSELYASGAMQDVTLEVSGGQLASDYITDTLCDNPPCATFTSNTGLAPPITGPQLAEGVFEWQTACSHVATDAGCGITSNIYTFAVKAFDDFCPANAITIATITVEVTAADSLPAVDLDCVWEDEDGDVVFNWDHPVGSSISTEYHIHAASNIGGPYSIIADVFYPINSLSTNLSLLPAGSNFFYVTSESTCADNSIPSDTISVIKFSVSSTDVNCWDDTDGTISVHVDNYTNVLQYQFSLDGIINTNAFPFDTAFNDVSAGNHILTVHDVPSGCIVDVPVTISAPGFPLQALASSEVVICNGSSAGEVVGSAAGGTPGYSYEWFDSGMNSFSTNDTASGLSAGSYYLEVMDANGCDTFTTVTVVEPQIPLTGSPQHFNVSCKGDTTGMIVGDASGSWAPYQYHWFNLNGDTLQSSPGYVSTRDTLANLGIGTYILTLIDSKGCSIDYTFNIEEPTNALSIDSMKVISEISCYGDSVGIARLYASGGDPAYSYLWDNGEMGIIANALTSGYHSVLLTDDWGCEVLDSIYIPENPLIESDLVVHTTVGCYGDSTGVAVISSVGGASSVYTYFWSQGQQSVGVNTDTASGLLHGSYYVTTRDILGCEVIDSIYISQPEPLIMEALELDWIDCFGYDNGEAFAFAEGGTAPYSFSWDNGVWYGDTVYTLTPGIRTVVVTDARGCTASDTVLIHEPAALVVSIVDSLTIHPYCVGVNTASLSALAEGGTPSYSYEWDNNPVQPQLTSTATALLAGTYTITVTDSKGCMASATETIVNIETMTDSIIPLATYAGGYHVSCYGEDDGQAFDSAWGGQAPYTYEWYGPNGYVSTNDTISNLLAGVYSVTVRDINNCMINSSIAITEPAALFFNTLGSSDATCLGSCDGTIQVDVIGGVSPYLAIATEITTGAIIDTIMNNNSLVSGICSGTYTLSFSDENGCPSTLTNGGVNTQTINTYDTTFAQINTSNISTILCNGSPAGMLEVLDPNIASGYSYSWQDLSGNVVGNDTTVSNLLAGTYVLYADYNMTTGCTSTDTATITELSLIDPSAVVTHVDCYGDATGVLQGSAQGGTPNYTYSWSNGGTTQNISSLQAGTYILTVTDNNNCHQADTFEVSQPQPLLTSITQSGYVLSSAIPTGGVPPYTYSWVEQTQPTVELGSLISYTVGVYGTYYVIVTDANGCEFISNAITYGDGLGTIDLSGDITLSIYPNPFREETTVDFGQKISSASITIVDIYGKLIERYDLTDTDRYSIKRTNKASGVYFMEIEIGGIEVINKIIIE